MASTKKLKAAAIKFRRTEPALHKLLSQALKDMRQHITKTGATEVTAEIYDGCIVDIV